MAAACRVIGIGRTDSQRFVQPDHYRGVDHVPALRWNAPATPSLIDMTRSLDRTMPLATDLRDVLLRTGTFMVRVMPSADWLAIRQRQDQALPWHETVLRPLVQAASSAWVYGIDAQSEVFAAAHAILRRERGKYSIALGTEVIAGHELLWNASGGKRGSIVLTMPMDRFPGSRIFPHCQEAFVVGNPTVPHTPSAVRFARAAIADGRTLCCLLSRSNGFEWISIHANAGDLEKLFAAARSLVAKREWYATDTT